MRVPITVLELSTPQRAGAVAVTFALTLAACTTSGGGGGGNCEDSCLHVRDGEVPVEECRIGQTAGENQQVDPRDASGRQYFETVNDYEFVSGNCGSGLDAGSEEADADGECGSRCLHVRDGLVSLEECSRGDDPEHRQEEDPRSPTLQTYAETKADYVLDRPEECGDAGMSDAGCDPRCVHVRDGNVPVSECRIGITAGDNQAVDPRDPNGRQYFETVNDYELITRC